GTATISNPSESFEDLAPNPKLSFFDFKDSIHVRAPLPNTPEEFISLYDRIITPYNPDNFYIELCSTNLLDQYLFLVDNLRKGFPL
ncbi:hypothetical protein C8R42DRAFT_533819, partial [Lentinula raphanica]